jgi:hypothetical protein
MNSVEDTSSLRRGKPLLQFILSKKMVAIAGLVEMPGNAQKKARLYLPRLFSCLH